MKPNADNERIKRKYFDFLKEAKGNSVSTVDATAKALNRFEEYTNYQDFKMFHQEQASKFKKHLAEQKGQQSGVKLSKATLHATLTQLKQFFQWLSDKPGYKSRFQYADAKYFNLPTKDISIATAQREKNVATLEQIKHVINTMPANTEIERRNRALVAFTLLTGARVRAIASMKLKHVDIINNRVHQDAREVETKFSKTFTTYFVRAVGEEVFEIFAEWVSYLLVEKRWGNDDPLFPATHIEVGISRQFEATGLTKKHWTTTTPIRKIFGEAFAGADLPYFNPHSFRDTQVRLGEVVCNIEEFKALSQNLGHENVMTTLLNYGAVPCHRQGELIRGLAKPKQARQPGADEIAEAVFKKFRGAGVDMQTQGGGV